MRDLIKANLGLLLVGMGSYIIMGAGQSIYGPALPVFAKDLGLTLTAAGWLISAFWIGCFMGVALMYFHSPRVTPRHSVAAMVIGAALIAFLPNLIGTFAGTLWFGFGYGISCVIYNPRILRAFGVRGTSMVSLLNAIFAIGAIAAPLVFLLLGSVPQRAFLAFAILGALMWLVAGKVEGETAQPDQSATAFNPRLGLQIFPVIAIGVEASLIGLGPTALIDMGLSPETAAQLLSVFFATFMGARILMVFFGHLLPPFTIYLFAIAATGFGALAATLALPGLFFGLLGAAASLFFPTFFVAATRAMGDDPRTPSIIVAAGLVGAIFAPIVLAGLLERLGGAGFFLVVAGLCGALFAAGLITRSRVEALRSI